MSDEFLCKVKTNRYEGEHDQYHLLLLEYGVQYTNKDVRWHPCGYLGVPEGHPLYGKHYDDLYHLDVHGGLTFSEEGSNELQEERGMDKDRWYIGFDCNHGCDNPRFGGTKKDANYAWYELWKLYTQVIEQYEDIG